jgi:transcriptional regulator with XRE-family HTH domain
LSRVEVTRFGEKLHTLRTQRGLTLKELAHALGHASHGYISELEAGKKIPTVEFVLGVALLFDVTTDLLLKDDCSLPTNSTLDKAV